MKIMQTKKPHTLKSPVSKEQSQILPQSNNQLYTQYSPIVTSQQNFFKKEEKIKTLTACNSGRTLLSSQSFSTLPTMLSFTNLHHQNTSQVIEKQKQIASLKAEVRVISSKLHNLKTKKFSSEQLTEQITNETIKGLNLNLAKKNHLINKIQKIVTEFQNQVKQKNIQISSECKCRMQQILQSIQKNQKNILVRQNISQKVQMKSQNKVVVIYREDGCEQDWRVWKDKYQQSQRRINQLNYQVERLYDHQNELISQRRSSAEQRSLLEIKIKNLTSQLKGWASNHQSNNINAKKAETEKQVIFRGKQELIKQNNELKTKIFQHQINENNFKSKIKMLTEHLQDSKKNIKNFYQWRDKYEKNYQQKSESLDKVLYENELKMKITSLNLDLSKANCNINDRQQIIRELQSEKSQLILKNQSLYNQTEIKILQVKREKDTLQQQIKSLEFKVRMLEEELQILKKMQRQQNNLTLTSQRQNNDEIDQLKRKIYEYELIINKMKGQSYQYLIYQEKLQKSKEIIRKLEKKLIQNVLDLQTLDMLKPKILKYQETISKLKYQISRLQSQQRNDQNNKKLQLDNHTQNSTTFQSQFFKESNIMENSQKDSQYILALQNKIYEYQNQLNHLKSQNSIYKSRIYQVDKSINNFTLSEVIEHHSQINEIIKRSKETINALEKKVNEYAQQLIVISEKNKRYQMKFDQKENVENPQTSQIKSSNQQEFKQAVSNINKFNSQLNQLYSEKNTLIEKINSKKLSEIEMKNYQARVNQIDDQKMNIVKQFQSIRYQLFSQIRQKDQIIKKLQYQVDHKNQLKQDQYFRYKADPRYLELKKKVYELQKSYTTHNETTHEFFKQYKKEHLQSHEKVLDLIRQTFATLKKFEQTVIIKKSKLKRFNMQRLKQLQMRIGQLKSDNLKLKQDCYEGLNKDFEIMKQSITNYIQNNA